MWKTEFEPKIITVFREGYTKELFYKDALAGIVVGIVALPLAIAFAIASGVRPEQGLFTAIIAGFCISLFSGSRVQIGGPTGAFVVIVYGIVEKFGYEGLAAATLLAGLFLVILGLARFGSVIRFIPYPVTIGFTSAIAVIIAVGQIRDALGLKMGSVPSGFIHKCLAYAENIASINSWALGITIVSVLIIISWQRVGSRIPGPLVAIISTTALVRLFDIPVESIATRFGAVPTELPKFRLPSIELALLPDLVSPAISIALLGAIESLLSAIVADGMTGRRHRSNAELVGQGIANICSPLFGGIPATGAIARTATNVRNGGATPVSGMIHALTLMFILVFVGQWVSMIPMATLAGILLVVSYNMSEAHVFIRLVRGFGSDAIVLAITFLLTIFLDLVVAIQAGVVLASLLFMRRMTDVTEIKAHTAEYTYEQGEESPITKVQIPSGVIVFEINGSFCFGAAQKFSEVLVRTGGSPKIVILRMRHVIAMDATGLHALEEVLARFKRSGVLLLLSGVQSQPLSLLMKSNLIADIPQDHIFQRFEDALSFAKRRLDGESTTNV
ncbi:MAG: STAS domain-containing protein [Bdellovibrionales bacterium]|nr:STAS domain-containing protein [Bdellovibrionales bacterium]